MKRLLGLFTLLAGGGLAQAQGFAPPLVPAPGCAAEPADCTTLWAEADYLLWWVKGAPLPVPLVTRGSPADANPGALGQPGTTVLYGNQGDDFGAFSGIRLKVGGWIDTDRLWSVEVGGFLLERRATGFAAADDGTSGAFLGIPANSLDQGTELIYGVAGFGFGGQVQVQNSLRLWGLEATASRSLLRDGGLSISALTGLRYLSLRENLDITTGPLNPGDVPISGADHFGTRNDFYGGQLGAKVGYTTGALSLDLIARVSLGVIDQGVNVNGSITFAPGAGPLTGTFPGNSLTQPTNIGYRSRTDFAFVPEVGVKARYQLTQRLAATVGYDFLFIDRVVRPGDQIDRNLNLTQAAQFGGVLAGPPFPQPRSEPTGFFAHGLNCGLTFTY